MSTRNKLPASAVRFGVISASLLCAAAIANAQPIADVLKTALPTHPRVLEAGAAIRSAEAEIAVAASALNPRVTLEGSTGLGRQIGDIGSPVVATPTLRWTKLLMDGGRVERDIDLRNARVRQAAAGFRVVEEDVALQIAQSYVQLAQAKEALRLARTWVNSLETIESMAREIATIDQGRQVDRVQAASRLLGARAQLNSRQAAVGQAAQQLEQLVDAHIFVETPVSLTFRMEGRPAEVAGHPKAEVAEAATRVAEAQLALDALYDKPRVDVEGFVGGGRDRFGRMRVLNQGGVRLLGNLNVLDGGAGKAVTDVSRFKVEQARTAAVGTARELKAALARDLAAEEGAPDRQSAYVLTVTEAEKLRGLMFEQFRAGRRPLLDLLSQEAEIFQSGLAQSQDYHDSLATRIRIAHERGELLASFGVQSALTFRN